MSVVGAPEGLQRCLALLKAPLEENTGQVYLVSAKWLVSFESDAIKSDFVPEPIDNNGLIEDGEEPTNIVYLEPRERFSPKLKAGLTRLADYVFVSPAAWQLLVQMYAFPHSQ